MRQLAGVLLAMVPAQAMAQESALLRFVACPIYRDADAGRKSGCWLADDAASGERYDVSLSPYKPDWNRAVLVEGRVAAKQDGACGGLVLDAVRTSILEEPCPRHMLPAEGFPGRKYVLQGRAKCRRGLMRRRPSICISSSIGRSSSTSTTITCSTARRRGCARRAPSG